MLNFFDADDADDADDDDDADDADDTDAADDGELFQSIKHSLSLGCCSCRRHDAVADADMLS